MDFNIVMEMVEFYLFLITKDITINHILTIHIFIIGISLLVEFLKFDEDVRMLIIIFIILLKFLS